MFKNFSIALRILRDSTIIAALFFALYFYSKENFNIQQQVPPSYFSFLFPTQVTSQGMEYKDFVSILLTAIGVIMAMLALVIGVMAIWGYSVLKQEIIRESKMVAEKTAKKEVIRITPSLATKAAEEFEDFDRNRDERESNANDYGQAAGGENGI